MRPTLSSSRRAPVLFRVAAGPRTGFGHLVRACSLAEALGVPPVVSVRGGGLARRTARRLGARVVNGASAAAVLAAERPALLVVDDRVASATAAWRRRARALGIPIVGIHDLGLGVGDADLIVDASIGATTAWAGVPALLGPAFAILNPRVAHTSVPRRNPDWPRVAVVLGGGARRVVALRIARSVARLHGQAEVLVAGGFIPPAARREPNRVRVVPASRLGEALAGADVAVVAAGVTLYEACALGVPAIAVAVVPSQRPAVARFAACGAAVDGGLVRPGRRDEAAHGVGRRVVRLLEDRVARQRLTRAARAQVDGQGATRVALAILSRFDLDAGRRAAR